MSKWTKVETSIYQRGDVYRVHTTAKDPYTGEIRHRRATLDEGATIEDARRMVETLKLDVTERRQSRQRSSQSVTDYAERWLALKAAELKPSAAETYMYSLEALTSFLGGVQIDDVRREDVQRWARWLERLRKDDGSQYSTASLRAWWRPARTMFRDAVADGLLPADPTFRVKPPTTDVKQVREQRTLSAAELGALVDATRDHVPHRLAEVAILAYCGIRSGELYGLQWGDVDWQAPCLHIRRSVSLDQITDTTKTGAERAPYMPDLVGWALLEHRARQQRLGYPTGDDDLVFPARSRNARRRSSLTKPLKLAAEKAGIDQKVTPQVLRRTYNSLLVSMGVDRIVLRSMIGHSSEQMTERYAGVRMDDKQAAGLRLIRGGDG